MFVEDQGKYRLSIDGRTVIDHAEIPKSAVAQTVVALVPGPHKVVLETLSAPQFGAERIKIGIAQEGTLVNQSAIDMARKSDAVIVAVGFNQDIETRGRRSRIPASARAG